MIFSAIGDWQVVGQPYNAIFGKGTRAVMRCNG
jgi:hypothetical protein